MTLDAVFRAIMGTMWMKSPVVLIKSRSTGLKIDGVAQFTVTDLTDPRS